MKEVQRWGDGSSFGGVVGAGAGGDLVLKSRFSSPYCEVVSVRRVVQIRGDVVLRPRKPWTPTVQSLLQHLHGRGLPVPEPLGYDEHLEYVRLVEGDGGDDAWPHQLKLPGLRSAGVLLRQLHEASTDWQPPAFAEWSVPAESSPVVCHGDPLSPPTSRGATARLSGSSTGMRPVPQHRSATWPMRCSGSPRSALSPANSDAAGSPPHPTGEHGPRRCWRATAGTSRSTSST